MKKEKSEEVKKLREEWNKLKTDKERIKFLVSEFSVSKKEAGEIVTKSWRDLPNEIKGYFNENKVQKYTEYIKEETVNESSAKYIITVDKRTEDYMAYLNGDKGFWDCGKTKAEAIGNLIITHREKFNIEIIY